jgi:hypothetical protein
MTTPVIDDQARELGRKVGEALLGTCDYPEAYLERQDMDLGLLDNMAFCLALDDVAMCCQGCGWYVEPGELDEDDCCEQCSEKED